jgi:hypothetical protein
MQLEIQRVTHLKGGKNQVLNCGSAANKRVDSDFESGQIDLFLSFNLHLQCKSDRQHCEYDEYHKTVDCQTPI